MRWECDRCEEKHNGAKTCCRCHGEGWYGDGNYCECPTGELYALKREAEFLGDPGPAPESYRIDQIQLEAGLAEEKAWAETNAIARALVEPFWPRGQRK